MTDPTLRELAQAVVDAPDDESARRNLGRWIGFHTNDCPALSLAVDILAALDAEREAGCREGYDKGFAMVSTSKLINDYAKLL